MFTVVMSAALLIGSMARADDEAKCLAGRAKAQGKYEQCVQKWLSKGYGGGYFDQAKISKCREKYAAAWTKLSALSGSTTCGGVARFTDNVTTVTDNLSGLVWEKKTTVVGSGTNFAGDRHDVDNYYSWSNSGTNGGGTAYTDFLSNLNNGGFAATNDWRLPTFAELMTLVNQPYPCTTAPCIDSAFGATQSNVYWSATTYAGFPNLVWLVYFSDGDVDGTNKTDSHYARAVRGGL